jgi:nucleobase:cation symporter-1, NCS1 family
MSKYVTKYIPSGATVKARATSLKAWELPKQESALAPPDVWTNADMDPTPPENQTWTLWTWMAYWATDTINLGTWETASSVIAVGLTWRDAIPIMVVGTSCVAVPMVLNGAIGARLHIPFSVIVRSSFGYYFAYFCIVSRSILAMFWLGIQGANGAQCITLMLTAIWPSYAHIKNHLPSDAGITTQGMISYFLFWIIQLPLLLIPPTRLRYLFMVKLVAAPITAIATLGWIVHKAGGSGDLFNIPAKVSGSARAWLWLNSMSAVTGSWATLACNIPDFSRYARSSKGQYIQLPFLPIIFTACGVLGIITTSASIVVYGEPLWNPLDIIEHWLGSHGGRAAAFFAALSWYIAQVGTNITANSISAANDLTVMFPRYVNIHRGCIIAAIIGGWVIVPWKILDSATTFLAFMGGYAVFLAPIAGIIASDYWLVKKKNVDVPALYDPHGRYRYDAGVNWRAAVAFIVPVAPLLPGLAYSINKNGTHVSQGILHLYDFDWLFGFVTSIFLYTTLSYFFPAKESLIEKTIFGYDEDNYDGSYSRYDRRGSYDADAPPERRVSTGNAKGFGNYGGVDVIGATSRHSLSSNKSKSDTKVHDTGDYPPEKV